MRPSIQDWERVLEPRSNELRVLCTLVNGGVGYSGFGVARIQELAKRLNMPPVQVDIALTLLDLADIIAWDSDTGEVFVRGMIEHFIETKPEEIDEELFEHQDSPLFDLAEEALRHVCQ